jgi:hypothetical protein
MPRVVAIAQLVVLNQDFDAVFPFCSAPATGNNSPETAGGVVFAGNSLISFKPGICSKCFRLFEMSGIEWRIAQVAIQRSFAATTTPAGKDARTLP